MSSPACFLPRRAALTCLITCVVMPVSPGFDFRTLPKTDQNFVEPPGAKFHAS